MKKYAIALFASFATALTAAAQTPLYIVNGVAHEQIQSIPHEEIEHIEVLPADEEAIARYGERASNGVMLVTLRYDQPAAFEAAPSFAEYIAGQVKWGELEPAARVILRYTVTPEGRTKVLQELESTNSRLKRRIIKAVDESPTWRPAMKKGQNIATEGVLSIQLPVGKEMQYPVELVIR